MAIKALYSPSTTWLSQVTIRLLEKADLPALEWEGEFTHFRRLYAAIFESTQQGTALMWVADLPDARIIGQLFLQLDGARTELSDGKTRAYIYGFRIRPEYRSQGLGTQMMGVVERYLQKKRFRRVTLNVACDNPGARRLYENLGYQVVGADPGQWSYLDVDGNQREVNEPAWRMEKKLLKVNNW